MNTPESERIRVSEGYVSAKSNGLNIRLISTIILSLGVIAGGIILAMTFLSGPTTLISPSQIRQTGYSKRLLLYSTNPDARCTYYNEYGQKTGTFDPAHISETYLTNKRDWQGEIYYSIGEMQRRYERLTIRGNIICDDLSGNKLLVERSWFGDANLLLRYSIIITAALIVWAMIARRRRRRR